MSAKYLTPILLVFLCTITLTGQDSDLPVGQVLDTVRCKKAPNHSYSLYVPSYYNRQKKWPVIYIYDAAGRGKNSAEIFSQAGEGHGFIIVASHNFRNGSFEKGVDAIDLLFEDVPKRLSINSKKVYTAGLSGGARMAAATAVLAEGIAGVIGFAAGNHSNFPIPPEAQFVWIGVAGHLDMNFTEMIKLREQLDQDGVKNRFMPFSGPHGWPSNDIISDAVEWMKMMTIDISIEKNKSLFNKFISDQINEAKSQYQKEQYDLSMNIINTLHSHFSSTSNADDIQSFYQTVISDEKAIKNNELIDSIQHAELTWMAQINNQLRELENDDPHLNMLELKKLIALFITAEKHEIKPLLRNMNNRLLGYIALYTNTKGMPLLFSKDYSIALNYLELWQATHPDIPSIAYFMSKYYAIAGKNGKARKMYECSVGLGHPPCNIENKKDLIEYLKDPKDFRRIGWEVAREWL